MGSGGQAAPPEAPAQPPASDPHPSPVPTAATARVPLADVFPPVVVIDPPEWVPDEACGFCTACKAPFTVIRRKHHCRSCGKVGGVAEVVPRPLVLSLRAS